MKRALENRSLDRGLAVLEALSIHGASGLQDLYAKTRLPKSTIRRLLATLMRRRVVRRSLADGLYRANIALPAYGRVSPTHGEGWLVDRAVPHMIELTNAVGWACDLHIFERTRGRIVESTRPLSPFLQYRRPLDLPVSVFGSAGGLAVLSTWPDAVVLDLVDEIGDHPVWGLHRAGLRSPDLVLMLRRARRRGYAVRPQLYRGETALAGTLDVIACPIAQRCTAVGALALLWPKGYLSTARFAELHLRQLERTVSGISAAL
ncbi:MAG: helix-turn-helix domain-containing protein [Hyphomicrobiaceae bacterium]